MNAALLVTLCLAADAPVSAPLPASNGTPTRVLRDDEKGGKRATVSATAAAIAAQAATAPSTNRKRPSSGCLFEVEDLAPREYAVHDLVTIIVAESSRSKSIADSKADKDYSMQAEVAAFMTLDPTDLTGGVQLDPDSLPVFDVSGNKRFKGKGNYNRSDDFTARVTAEIVDIRPNGLLVLEARREIVNDGETQVIVLSGICRPEDVDANNQVTSQRIADAVIKKTTTGQLRDTSEKGVLARVLDSIFAF
ncbi:MAG: flagellar L-ring protein [Planctomycetota bacterium]|jgi:flagellar L-ring protein precursor FlgH